MNLIQSSSQSNRRQSVTKLLIALFALVLALFVYAPVNAQGGENAETPVEAEQLAGISPYLADQLNAAGDPVSILVILKDQVNAQEMVSASGMAEMDRATRADNLYRNLTAHALQTQAPIRQWLDEQGVPYRAFYIVNMIEVKGDAALAQNLRALPGVDRLVGNPQVAGQQAVESASAASWLQQTSIDGPSTSDVAMSEPFGLPYTQAPAVWALGYTGQGVIVASQDTGVQWDHPALIDSYRGWDAATNQADHAYNWLDAFGAPIRPPTSGDACGSDSQAPCDDWGHGTHTVGTMVGDASNDPNAEYYNARTVLGMAPDAEWMGCRNMRNGVGDPASYTDCFQFMLAPYPQNGDAFADGRTDLAPHIINNSWSCPESEGCDAETLRRVVDTTRAAGQLIVASASNDGKPGIDGCQTIQYPIGIYDSVFTVGAHDRYGTIAYFSSRGPVASDGSNRLKPDISGPGVSILSTDYYNGYKYNSGTSMSSPHVAGAAALLWSAAPELIGNIDLTEEVLIKSATPALPSEADKCLPGAPTSPNMIYGYGRLDVLEAVLMARSPWEMVVKVTDADNKPQEGVRIVVQDELTKYRFNGTTNTNGVARFKTVFNGDYKLIVGTGDLRYVKGGINLQAGSSPDDVERIKRIQVVYPQPTAIDQDEPPSIQIFLPHVSHR